MYAIRSYYDPELVNRDFWRRELAQIDTARCPLYLLTGEYDYSCTPDDTRELARLIGGARATIMQGMTETMTIVEGSMPIFSA